jgi:hypothetical protein
MDSICTWSQGHHIADRPRSGLELAGKIPHENVKKIVLRAINNSRLTMACSRLAGSNTLCSTTIRPLVSGA